MKNIVVLGAGLVGKAIILDLYKSFNITVVDISLDNLSNLGVDCNRVDGNE